MTIHTVKSGDSVYSIAREYGTSPTRIIQDNLLDNPSRLVVGEDLVILQPTESYTVRGGDTLTSIAQNYGTTVGALYRNNPVLGGRPNVYPGQMLNISFETPPLGEIASNGYAYTTIDSDVLRRTLPYLTYLSVFSYGIDGQGELIPPGNGEDAIVALAREYGTVPLLVLTSLNEDGKFSPATVERVLTDPALAARVAESVVRNVTGKGYGGLDVDFEYIPGEYAEAYADFLVLLEEALGGDYPVFVSLAPKTSADQPGLLYEGHSYPLLGDAADRALLMTYEWGYTYGPPLPVSPLGSVRRVVDYAVGEIEPEKLFLGVPNYGYDWALPYVRGESKAQSLGNEAAVNLALQRKAEIKYDEAAASPFFTYYDRPETYSDAVEHVVWFENARSAEAMLRLVNEYGLYGIGVWNLTRYFPSLWNVLNSLYSIKKI